MSSGSTKPVFFLSTMMMTTMSTTISTVLAVSRQTIYIFLFQEQTFYLRPDTSWTVQCNCSLETQDIHRRVKIYCMVAIYIILSAHVRNTTFQNAKIAQLQMDLICRVPLKTGLPHLKKMPSPSFVHGNKKCQKSGVA